VVAFGDDSSGSAVRPVSYHISGSESPLLRLPKAISHLQYIGLLKVISVCMVITAMIVSNLAQTSFNYRYYMDMNEGLAMPG